MKATITIDDELLSKAQEYSGIEDTSAIVHAALTAFVQLEAGRLLARLGGSEPQLRPVPRRRSR